MDKWIVAFRLRTLPLSLSGIVLGNLLSISHHSFKISVFILSIITTVILQILSNLSNDYGDYVNGADNDSRKGPLRQVQKGVISPNLMKKAIIINIIFSLISGISLIYVAFENEVIFGMAFFLLGIMAIIASVRYTVGKKPYGYAGLGDLSVFIFFGLLSIVGSYFLQTKTFDFSILLVATSCGLFSVGVLNINNIRDIDSDRIAKKKSIPVRIGRKNATIYHSLLIVIGFILSIIYCMIHFYSYYQFMFLATIPLFAKNIIGVTKNTKPLDPYLGQLSITIFIFTILFGLFNTQRILLYISF